VSSFLTAHQICFGGQAEQTPDKQDQFDAVSCQPAASAEQAGARATDHCQRHHHQYRPRYRRRRLGKDGECCLRGMLSQWSSSASYCIYGVLTSLESV